MALCDRGTLDGLAYWPLAPEAYFDSVYSSRASELRRYSAVIHLRTPTAFDGYNHDNPLRVENAAEAARIDERIAAAWQGHPRRFFVESQREFLAKVAATLELILAEVPPCCRKHHLAELDHDAPVAVVSDGSAPGTWRFSWVSCGGGERCAATNGGRVLSSRRTRRVRSASCVTSPSRGPRSIASSIAVSRRSRCTSS